MVMGIRPILDIVVDSWLPNLAEDFAANLTLAGLAIGHDALACGEDSSGETTSDRAQIIVCLVDTKTWLAHARDLIDQRLALCVV
jgi:hypothetical protein